MSDDRTRPAKDGKHNPLDDLLTDAEMLAESRRATQHVESAIQGNSLGEHFGREVFCRREFNRLTLPLRRHAEG